MGCTHVYAMRTEEHVQEVHAQNYAVAAGGGNAGGAGFAFIANNDAKYTGVKQ